MSPSIGWQEVALRLFFTVAAGTLIGVNRGEHGRPAGLRTTLLVCLAASLSMIQANLMLASAGKSPDSFVVLDLMRLPLGVLSGMGFIGAGAILRKENMVVGVTTAATLWFVTLLGLCFGGGQIGLGCAALALGLATLTLLKKVENRWSSERQGTLVLSGGPEGPTEEEVAERLRARGYRVASWTHAAFADQGRTRETACEVHWRAPHREIETLPPFCRELAALPGIVKVEWKG